MAFCPPTRIFQRHGTFFSKAQQKFEDIPNFEKAHQNLERARQKYEKARQNTEKTRQNFQRVCQKLENVCQKFGKTCQNLKGKGERYEADSNLYHLFW